MGTTEIEAVRAFCVFVRAAGGGREWLTDATDEQVRSMIVIGDVLAKMQRGMESTTIATPKGPLLVAAGPGGDVTLEAGWMTSRWVADVNAAEAMFHALVEAGGPLAPEPPVEEESIALGSAWVVLVRSVGGNWWARRNGGDTNEMAYADVFTEEQAREEAAKLRGYGAERLLDVLAESPDGSVGRALHDALAGAPKGLDTDEATAIATWAVAFLQVGRSKVDTGPLGVVVERVDGRWKLTKDGKDAALVSPSDAWDLLRDELARLLR